MIMNSILDVIGQTPKISFMIRFILSMFPTERAISSFLVMIPLGEPTGGASTGWFLRVCFFQRLSE